MVEAEAPPVGDTKRKMLWRQRNAARARDHVADERNADASGVALAQLRTTAELPYDTNRHRLLPIVVECLGLVGGSEDDRALLEALQPLQPSESERRRFRGGDRGPASVWVQRWLSEAPEYRKAHAAFNAAYLELLRDVVRPHIADPRGLLFQRRPTFRCHVAGGGEATGVAHRDVDNGHPPAEINFWLPLTRVGGTNSLYAESAPDLADFTPFESDYGRMVRFWGAQCVHYTKPNETDRTRVSFDFRVVPRSCYVAAECEGGRADPYRPGEFYGEMDALGNVVI